MKKKILVCLVAIASFCLVLTLCACLGQDPQKAKEEAELVNTITIGEGLPTAVYATDFHITHDLDNEKLKEGCSLSKAYICDDTKQYRAIYSIEKKGRTLEEVTKDQIKNYYAENECPYIMSDTWGNAGIQNSCFYTYKGKLANKQDTYYVQSEIFEGENDTFVQFDSLEPTKTLNIGDTKYKIDVPFYMFEKTIDEEEKSQGILENYASNFKWSDVRELTQNTQSFFPVPSLKAFQVPSENKTVDDYMATIRGSEDFEAVNKISIKDINQKQIELIEIISSAKVNDVECDLYRFAFVVDDTCVVVTSYMDKSAPEYENYKNFIKVLNYSITKS